MAGIDKIPLVVLVGPTAVGKTGVALELAGRFGAEILSADSLQVYRRMDIGTAKPTADQRRIVPHHLIDVVDPDEPFDASTYLSLAREKIAHLHGSGKKVFVVGGSGLYIKALLEGLIRAPGADEDLRRSLRDEARALGPGALYGRLKEVDPRAAARISPGDMVRIVRALEVWTLTGRSIVDYQNEHRFRDSPYRPLKIGLALERGELRRRIEARTDSMISQGLIDEVRSLVEDYGRAVKPMQAIGYRHLASALAGEIPLAEAIRLIKKDTYAYAKRQETWFSADRGITWLSPHELEEALQLITCFYAEGSRTKGP